MPLNQLPNKESLNKYKKPYSPHSYLEKATTRFSPYLNTPDNSTTGDKNWEFFIKGTI